MADTKMLLWTDTESTGLLDQRPAPTVLEAAWTITDITGRQITPLAQAFCALPVENVLTTPAATTDPETERTVGYWDVPGHYPSQPVRDMHDANGLLDEWANAAPDTVLRDWSELERLILDDLQMAGWWGLEKRELQLAGGGVANYEARFLPDHLERIFHDERMHYRAHDLSVTLSVLRVRSGGVLPGNADEVIKALRGRDDLTAEWDEIFLSPRYGSLARDGIDSRWADLDKDNHRAAVGVARALMAYRLLPDLVRLSVASST